MAALRPRGHLIAKYALVLIDQGGGKRRGGRHFDRSRHGVAESYGADCCNHISVRGFRVAVPPGGSSERIRSAVPAYTVSEDEVGISFLPVLLRVQAGLTPLRLLSGFRAQSPHLSLGKTAPQYPDPPSE
jgi:hypothetical protein